MSIYLVVFEFECYRLCFDICYRSIYLKRMRVRFKQNNLHPSFANQFLRTFWCCFRPKPLGNFRCPESSSSRSILTTRKAAAPVVRFQLRESLRTNWMVFRRITLSSGVQLSENINNVVFTPNGCDTIAYGPRQAYAIVHIFRYTMRSFFTKKLSCNVAKFSEFQRRREEDFVSVAQLRVLQPNR